MQHGNWQRTKRILFNDTGQMTVFVALIFQVLFVFFAMVINIGLIVHDKINLQNAVDLGAYYGAQRQAEILNEIAHVNYQIRQDYKLLTWRYRVLGTLGRGAPGNPSSVPPARTAGGTFDPLSSIDELPSVCVANLMWREALASSDQNENYCYQGFGPGFAIPEIPKLPVAYPIPFIGGAALQINNAFLTQQRVAFMKSGPWNWAFAAQIMQAYKMAISSRKAVIQKLRKNLVAESFVDQNSQSVSLGVLTTIRKNLTLSNAESFDEGAFKVMNGLANPTCVGPNNDGAPTIAEIRTAPTLLYTYPVQQLGHFYIQQAAVTDTSPLDQTELSNFDPSILLRYFSGEPTETPSLDDINGLNASSLGFEKNPWCMAYVGVHAKSHPRKPFAPFGQPVTLEARAFAQPFGGRVGPWYSRQWAASADFSSGQPVDPLTSPRFSAGVGANNGQSRLPNYSRFPGDPIGLKSRVSQAAERLLVSSYSQGSKLSFGFFSDFGQISQTGDPLAWDATVNDQSAVTADVRNIRTAEIIAVAPDVFDATYYSIDLFYPQNYKNLNANNNRFPDLPSIFGVKITVPPDIGGRNGIAGLQEFSVANQIANVLVNNGTGIDPELKSAGLFPFMVFDQWNLLTGWAPNAAQEYSFPLLRYGRCSGKAKASLMIPGGCAQGGRTGYSVRLISRDHLVTKKWLVGGDGEAAAGLRNPPPNDF